MDFVAGLYYTVKGMDCSLQVVWTETIVREEAERGRDSIVR